MGDASYLQKRMQEIQKEESFAEALGKILSGKAGYKPVIEKREVIISCKQCTLILDNDWSFCPNCGLKIEKENPEEKKEN